MDTLIASLQNLPQWWPIVLGVLVAYSIAILVMVEDL